MYNFCGYRITSLTEKDAEIVRRYRFNEENISNYCLAKNTFFDYIQGNGEDFVFKKEWGFPYSGSYIGYIMNCSPSMKHCGEYYVAFLADNYDVCLFKFTTTFRDAVYNGVQRDLGLTSTIFRQADYSCLKGYLVLISVDNITLESGNVFSKIMHAKTVQEILDIPVEPEEMLSYFDAVEQFGSIEEESIFYGKIVIQKLKDVSSEKKRRAFLI